MGDNEISVDRNLRQGDNAAPQEMAIGIFQRVKEKKESYQRYNFERSQEEAFATFFDLAQEFTTIEAIYQICVAVPKEFFDLESRLYVVNPNTRRPMLLHTGGLLLHRS